MFLNKAIAEFVLIIFEKSNSMLKYIVLSFALLFCVYSFAQEPEKFKEITIYPGQTLFSVSRDYKIDVKLLKKYNPKYTPDFKLKIGDVLKLPIFMSDKENSETIVVPIEKKDSISAISVKEALPQAEQLHTVAKGETLYSISKKYGKTTSELKALNSLPEDLSIKIGQRLIISKGNQSAAVEVMNPAPASSAPALPSIEKTKPILTKKEDKRVEEKKIEKIMTENTALEESFSGTVNKNSKKVERGIGKFSNESELTSASFVYYDNAEMGAIIKVVNLMSKRILFMKVVGPIPQKLKEDDLVLVVSPEAVKVLGANEDKFLVEITSY
jgi:LysM repeat protein